MSNIEKVTRSFECNSLKALYERSDIQPPKVIVEDMLTAGLHLIASPPKAGKSTLMTQLGLSIVDGDPFLGHKVTQGSVFHIENEISESGVWAKAHRIAIDRSVEGNYMYSTTNPYLTDDNFFPDLQHIVDLCAEKGKPLVLIILDMYVNAIDPVLKRSGNVYELQNSDLKPIRDFATKNSLAFTIVHHTSKTKNTDNPFERASGSTAMTGATNVNWILTEKDKNGCQMLYVQGKDVPSSSYQLIIDPELGGFREVGYMDTVSDSDFFQFVNDPAVKTIRHDLQEKGAVVYSCKQLRDRSEILAEELTDDSYRITDTLPQLGKKLNIYTKLFEQGIGVVHKDIKEHTGRKHMFANKCNDASRTLQNKDLGTMVDGGAK